MTRMLTNELAQYEDFAPLVEGEPREITSVYCADLLSWAMGAAPEGCAWCTVMGNVNAIAVASLADVAVVLLCEGAAVDDEAKLKAEQQGIQVYQTALPAFEAGLAIARAAKLYGET